MKTKSTEWFVYIIEANDGSWYTGVTTDLERRFDEHASSVKGARYFRGRQPRKVVFVEGSHNRVSAHQREAQIKKMRRSAKVQMVGEETVT